MYFFKTLPVDFSSIKKEKGFWDKEMKKNR